MERVSGLQQLWRWEVNQRQRGVHDSTKGSPREGAHPETRIPCGYESLVNVIVRVPTQ